MSKRVSALSFCSLFLCACAAAGAPASGAPASAAPGDLLPRPYTAAEIRAGNPPGATRVFLISQAGQPPVLQTTRFLDDPEGEARFETLVTDLAGEPVKERSEGRATWEELQAHADFPAAETRLCTALCTVAAGVFQGSLYERSEPTPTGATEAPAPGGAAVVHRFWFADGRPGPPVLYEMTRGDELLYRMELVELRGAAP
jgi:hypothetical protein